MAEKELPGEKAPPAAEVKRTETSWPVFRGNPALNGIAKDELLAPLKLSWKVELSGAVLATAAVLLGTRAISPRC